MAERLTGLQIALLERLASGEHITYSQDGEVGWLWPSRTRLEQIGIPDAELHDLRERRLIAMLPDDDDYGRFGPPDAITAFGRAALNEARDD